MGSTIRVAWGTVRIARGTVRVAGGAVRVSWSTVRIAGCTISPATKRQLALVIVFVRREGLVDNLYVLNEAFD